MQQNELTNILEHAHNYDEALRRLLQSSLANSDWNVEHWEPEMLETAVKIAQKWKSA